MPQPDAVILSLMASDDGDFLGNVAAAVTLDAATVTQLLDRLADYLGKPYIVEMEFIDNDASWYSSSSPLPQVVAFVANAHASETGIDIVAKAPDEFDISTTDHGVRVRPAASGNFELRWRCRREHTNAVLETVAVPARLLGDLLPRLNDGVPTRGRRCRCGNDRFHQDVTVTTRLQIVVDGNGNFREFVGDLADQIGEESIESDVGDADAGLTCTQCDAVYDPDDDEAGD